ncbi:DHHA1 domain-containing protein [Metabacillus sp. GX 13764]|uniref:DHH family phosphoesterase n=1 Tax=Metabacillus kandeliae TaxID=2900151 RepID=UPI001E3A83B6|nr:DHHA1 domain-containing protein [Metabacillus kandeliae]MCD7035666.1 DHHA1 domain-containing protein [Metabacillus kandeliae]
MKLFTDSDLDGLGCSALAKLAYGDKADVYYCSPRNLNQRVEYFLDQPDNSKIDMTITDLSVNEEIEARLEERFKKGQFVQLIDHHVTAMRLNDRKWGFVKPEYEDGRKSCATSLYYEYLMEHGLLEQTGALDEFTDLVRQYDTWEWEKNENVKAKRLNDLFYLFERGKFEEDILRRLRENKDAFDLTETETMLMDIEENKISRYINAKNRQIIQTFVDEFCVGLVHAEQYLSELGNALNKLNPHLDMIVLLNVGGKKAGFRTIHEDVNVSEFASRFGGGGHPKASGCELTEEAFDHFVLKAFPLQPLKPDPERNELNVKNAPYGTYYENRLGDISFIMPVSDQCFEVLQNGENAGSFSSYEEAERHIKRHYGSWLRFDDACVLHLSTALRIPAEEVKANYEKAVKQAFNG